MATPYVTIVRNVVGSTQDLAANQLELAERPVLVVAQRQTSGRGRSGNHWWQAPRAVAASLAFATDTEQVEGSYSLAVGLAVRAAIRAATGVDVALKWPNDLELGQSKVGGILVERTDNKVVVGCGLNLYWPNAPALTGGLMNYDPGDRIGLEISEAWAAQLLDSGGMWDRHAYIAACSTIGASLTWEPDGTGVAITVAEDGGLVVDTDDGRVILRSGEVRTVRLAGTSDDA